MAGWRNYFSQLLNLHGVNEVRLREIHTAEILVPETSAFEVKFAIKKVISHKSPGSDQISAEMNKQGLEQFAMRSINLLFLYGIRGNYILNILIYKYIIYKI